MSRLPAVAPMRRHGGEAWPRTSRSHAVASASRPAPASRAMTMRVDVVRQHGQARNLRSQEAHWTRRLPAAEEERESWESW
jgi:hypothetical protein